MKGFFDPKTIVPNFEDHGHKVPAHDMKILRMLCRDVAETCNKLERAPSVLEIGSFCGVSTCVIASELLAYSKIMPKILCVDPWGHGAETDPDVSVSMDEVFKAWRKNTGYFKNAASINYCRCKSEKLSVILANKQSYDLVYIDADHSEEAVKRDIEMATPLVRRPGILCGHDFGEFPGVTNAAIALGLDGVFGNTWIRYLD